MTTATVVPRTVHRLVIDLDVSFDEFRARYEWAVPRHDPGVMLYAPLRALLYEDFTGRAHFAIEEPSQLFASFGDPAIAATGRLLDEKLAALFRTLGLSVPDGLAATKEDVPMAPMEVRS